MVGILLLILKCIGFFLAFLLVFLLLFLLLLLFLPFRYRLRGQKEEEIMEGMARISWGGFFLKAFVNYDKEQGLSYKIKILGLDILAFLSRMGKRKEKKALSGREDKERLEQEKGQAKESLPPSKEALPLQDSLEEKPQSKEEEGKEVLEETKGLKKETKILGRFSKVKKEKKKGKAKKEKKKKVPLSQKIKDFWGKLKSKKENLEEKIHLFTEKAAQIKEDLTSDEFKSLWQLGKKELISLLRHIRPRKIEGNLLFGMENPADTGQLLGLAAIFYPYYQKSLSIFPDFDKKILEGNLFIKGRIQVYKFLLSAWRLYRCKELRYLINKYGGKKNGRK